LLASTVVAPIPFLCVSDASAQQVSYSDPLPPIEINAPVDQNRTRARPTYDESSAPRRVAPNATPAGDPNPAPGSSPGSLTSTMSSS